MTFKAK